MLQQKIPSHRSNDLASLCTPQEEVSQLRSRLRLLEEDAATLRGRLRMLEGELDELYLRRRGKLIWFKRLDCLFQRTAKAQTLQV